MAPPSAVAIIETPDEFVLESRIDSPGQLANAGKIGFFGGHHIDAGEDAYEALRAVVILPKTHAALEQNREKLTQYTYQTLQQLLTERAQAAEERQGDELPASPSEDLSMTDTVVLPPKPKEE